jgi:hypothetical protein
MMRRIRTSFQAALAGRYGNCGRSNLPFGEGTIAINQSLFRNFQIPWFLGERPAKFRVGVLMYNAINHSSGESGFASLWQKNNR